MIGLRQGSFPHFRGEDVEAEKRLGGFPLCPLAQAGFGVAKDGQEWHKLLSYKFGDHSI